MTGKMISFKDFADFLESWNKIQNTPEKITQLEFMLDDFGLGFLPGYSKACAEEKRKAYLGGLNKSMYLGAILPKTAGTAAAVTRACGG